MKVLQLLHLPIFLLAHTIIFAGEQWCIPGHHTSLDGHQKRFIMQDGPRIQCYKFSGSEMDAVELYSKDPVKWDAAMSKDDGPIGLIVSESGKLKLFCGIMISKLVQDKMLLHKFEEVDISGCNLDATGDEKLKIRVLQGSIFTNLSQMFEIFDCSGGQHILSVEKKSFRWKVCENTALGSKQYEDCTALKKLANPCVNKKVKFERGIIEGSKNTYSSYTVVD